jgi:hypothetical protein
MTWTIIGQCQWKKQNKIKKEALLMGVPILALYKAERTTRTVSALLFEWHWITFQNFSPPSLSDIQFIRIRSTWHPSGHIQETQ